MTSMGKSGFAALALPALLLASTAGLAATTAELEDRIEALEQQLGETPAADDGGAADQFDGVLSNTEFSFGGYIKADFLYSRYSDGVPGDAARQFYFPSRVPVAATEDDGDATDFFAEQTRFNVTSLTKIGDATVKGFIEIDFYGSGGTETITNSGGARIRHAFLTYQHCGECATWLAGQTWTNFMDLGAYPETLDFIGPAESIPFIRQTQLRVSMGNLHLSLENPETQISANPAVAGSGGTEGEEDLPDFVARYNLPTGFGHLSFAGLLRKITNEGLADAAGRSDDDTVGYGLSVAGRVNVGSKDNLKFSVNYGDGLGRYIGIGLVDAAVLEANGDLETIEYVSSYVAYQHHWSSHWRSNLVIGTLQIDNETDLTGTAVSEDASSAHVNLLYSPVPKLTFGIEYAYMERSLESGLEGDADRVQVSAILGL